MLLQHLLLLSLVLFAVGAAVFFTRSLPLAQLCGAEAMLNAGILAYAAFARLDSGAAQGQVAALFIMVVAVAETAVLLALLFLAQHPQQEKPVAL